MRRACSVHPVADLQIEYSLLSRSVETEILPVCRELGVGVTAYGVLSRGLLSGHWTKGRALAPGDFRLFAPRFAAENIDHNLELVDRLRAIAESRGASIAQLAIAWVLSRGANIVPLVGARQRDRLREALGALNVELTRDDLEHIERVFPGGSAAGERYPAPHMRTLDSEL